MMRGLARAVGFLSIAVVFLSIAAQAQTQEGPAYPAPWGPWNCPFMWGGGAGAQQRCLFRRDRLFLFAVGRAGANIRLSCIKPLSQLFQNL